MKESAGTLLYRRTSRGWEALIVRPSGPAARWGWSIPKGLPNPGEELEKAARRETEEETGCIAEQLTYLGHITYRKSPKRVHCFAGPAAAQEPRAASWEVDRAEFLPLDEGQKLLHPDQRGFIELLRAHLKLLAGAFPSD
jgi:predicted NUDIX family NTP pyrophosphohydrolase